MSEKEIFLFACYYGKNKYLDGGVLYFSFNIESEKFTPIIDFKIKGKINFLLKKENFLIVPIYQKLKSGFLIYKLHENTLVKKTFFESKFFYNYGTISDKGVGYFSSFASGVDSVVDFNSNKELSYVTHKNGKSHFINLLKSGVVYSIDNAADKLYLYQIKNNFLDFKKEISIGNEASPRLMPADHLENIAYLVTEKTNQIISFNLKTFKELNCVKVPGTEKNKDFCGGVSLSESDSHLVVTVRGQNRIVLFKLDEKGGIYYLDSLNCGKMPRDVLIRKKFVFVSCTDSNRIEIYKISDDKLFRVDSYLEVPSPVTFALNK